MNEINAILTIAFRDLRKLLGDRTRILASLVFPFLFIGALGGSLQASLGDAVGYNFLTFVFTGVIAQTMFQSTAAGIISLIEDRENDFSQEIFVSPISRYSIIAGKILGESLVALIQGVGILLFAVIVRVPMDWYQLGVLLPASLLACLLGGGFGVLVLSNLSSQRTANQIFPFLLFPQFFLAGVFNPIKDLPLVLEIFSRISPMRYAVDLVRGLYYWGRPEYSLVVLDTPMHNVIIMMVMMVVFLVLGTFLFVRNERNR